MNEQGIKTICAYSQEFLPEPGRNWPKYRFNQRSYARWAAAELVNLISDHPFVPADITVEKFIIQCSYYADCFNENTKQNLMFSVARDVASDILDILHAMK